MTTSDGTDVPPDQAPAVPPAAAAEAPTQPEAPVAAAPPAAPVVPPAAPVQPGPASPSKSHVWRTVGVGAAGVVVGVGLTLGAGAVFGGHHDGDHRGFDRVAANGRGGQFANPRQEDSSSQRGPAQPSGNRYGNGTGNGSRSGGQGRFGPQSQQGQRGTPGPMSRSGGS
jgi:hypothetical protein